MPLDPELWTPERYPEFLERRRYAARRGDHRLSRTVCSPGVQPETAEVPLGPEALPQPLVALEAADEEERVLADLRNWMRTHGFDEGELNHELVEPDSSVSAVLDLAWPRGLQVELNEPVALLVNAPLDVHQVAARNGYRPFTSVEELRAYATDLETLGAAASAAA